MSCRQQWGKESGKLVVRGRTFARRQEALDLLDRVDDERRAHVKPARGPSPLATPFRKGRGLDPQESCDRLRTEVLGHGSSVWRNASSTSKTLPTMTDCG